MLITDTNNSYGIITILLHWIMAILVIGLFFLGEYMVDLTYYDKWYNKALWWHDSIGISVFFLLLVRLVWKLNSVNPKSLKTYKSFEIIISKITHTLFYILLLVICISGYFISTAKGGGISFFDWFAVPAIVKLNEIQANFVGKIHDIATHIFAVLLALHVAATLKHHFFYKDITLIRILKPTTSEERLK